MPSKAQFTLGDHNAGVFAEICKKNEMPLCWLQWKFELAILNGATSPVAIDTKSDGVCCLKSGVNQVVFAIDFDQKNPNVINYVKFKESYEDREKKHFVVTQTSIDHVHEDTGCDLWLEVPANALHEDIGAVVNLWKVKLCCNGWKDFLPVCPATQLEKAHRVVSVDNVEWLQKQLIRTVGFLKSKSVELAAKDKDIENLTTQFSEVSMKLADAEKEIEDSKLRGMGPPLKRKMVTPKSRARGARKSPGTSTPGPSTAPARTSTAHSSGRSGQNETPSRETKFSQKIFRPDLYDPFT
ncbi:hypothetical protein diail_2703 [Diaporthe ilicicola]|nr:hypothetical protein diail_2703 [Diaporthe ilicicola]